MPLDSDTPNADAHLRAEFFTYNEDGPWKGVPHIRIITPGDKTNIPVLVATDLHKRRFQREWLHYQMANSEEQIIGTPLSQWRKDRPEEVSDGQIQELFILKFQSVEQVAMASDMQVQRVGMGAAGLRERARSYLSGKNAQASGAELQGAKSEIEAMKAEMAALKALLQAPQPAPAARAAPALAPAKAKGWPRGRKRGRKAKVIENVNNDSSPVGPTGL